MFPENIEKKKKLDNFAVDFDKLDDLVEKILHQMAPELQANPDKPAIIGFSMRIDSNGKPLLEEFGNVSKAGEKAAIAKAREPLVDVQIAEKNIFVTVELPGVEKKDIRLNVVDAQTLEIIVSGANSFYKKLSLPLQVKNDSALAKFKNGILEISLERVSFERKESGIKIE